MEGISLGVFLSERGDCNDSFLFNVSLCVDGLHVKYIPFVHYSRIK